jgi:long-chain acyl-CoA synthetase
VTGAPALEPLAATVARRAVEQPARTALRKKHLGRWRGYAWAEVGERVGAAAAGLRALGVGPDSRVALLADNRPAWVLADLAAQSLGAVTVGLVPDIEAADVGRLVKATGATVLVAEDEEQVDKALLAQGRTSRLERIVVVDPRGVDVDGDLLRTWADVEAQGRSAPLDLVASAGSLDLDAPATFVCTTEPDGPFQAALVSHRELAAAADVAAAAFGLAERTELLSHVSLARAGERVVSVGAVVRHGAVVSFPESPASFPRDLHDVQPTFLLGGPHLWAGLHAEVESRMAAAGRVKASAYRWAIAGGPGALRSLLVHRPLRRRLGLGRLAAAASTGTPAPDDLAWARALGIDVRDEPFRPLATTEGAVVS